VEAWHVFCNRRAEPQMLAADRRVGDALATAGLEVSWLPAWLRPCSALLEGASPPSVSRAA
jgi:hypothetical protein